MAISISPRRTGYVAADLNTIIRGLIAAVVIIVTFKLTERDATAPKDWEAILLVVVGYYFKDRPIEESLWKGGRTEEEYRSLIGAARVEILMQFALALALVAFTVAALVARAGTISAAWIASVVLAVGFYFKESSPQVQRVHTLLQTVIASVVALLTLVFISPGLYPQAPEVPIQWVAVVLVIVAFYFKERSTAVAL